jgi:hypothetical protein
MKVVVGVAIVTLGAIAVACKGPSKEELQIANIASAESLSLAKSQLLEQMMEGSRFVNELNAELAKARSMAIAPRKVAETAELTDINEERRRVLARINQIVTRLDNVSFRLSTTRNQLIERDSTLARKIAEHELLLAEATQAAERQRQELQAIVDAQTVRIASLTGTVDTLTGTVGKLTAERNAVYVIVGTKAELLKKGVLVADGPRQFGVVGKRAVAPARMLDPTHFTRLDRTTDSTIILPHGVYKIVSRQNTQFASKPDKNGTFAGAITIEDGEQFWSPSKFLIVVRS